MSHSHAMETIRREPSPQHRPGLPSLFASLSEEQLRPLGGGEGSRPRAPTSPSASRGASAASLPSPPPAVQRRRQPPPRQSRSGTRGGNGSSSPSGAAPGEDASATNADDVADGLEESSSLPGGDGSISVATRDAGGRLWVGRDTAASGAAARPRLNSATPPLSLSTHSFRNGIMETRMIATRSFRNARTSSVSSERSLQLQPQQEDPAAIPAVAAAAADDASSVSKSHRSTGADPLASSGDGSAGGVKKDADGRGGAGDFLPKRPQPPPGSSSFDEDDASVFAEFRDQVLLRGESSGGFVLPRSAPFPSQQQPAPPVSAAAANEQRQRSIKYFRNMAKAKAMERRGLTSSAPRTGEFPQQLAGGVKLRRSVLLLLGVGVLAGLLARLVEEGIRALEIVRNNHLLPLADAYGVKFLLFWGYMVVGVAAAVLLTAVVAPEAAGSGIPVMKYLMGTDDVRIKTARQFSLRALLVKSGALVLAAGAGMNIGREGPFTHIAGMVAWLLMKHVAGFESLYDSEALIRAALAAAVAVGVSTTFTAVIGGVLFSIEVTSTYYRVDNYFKGFVASVGGAVAVQLVVRAVRGAETAKRAVRPTAFTIDSYRFYEYPLFLVIGCVMGMLGPLYVRLRLRFMQLLRGLSAWKVRDKPARKREFQRRAVGVGCGVATVTALLSFFPGPYAREGPFSAFAALLTVEGLGPDWSSGLGGIWVALPVSAIVRAFTAALGTAIVVPAGDFILTAVIGASLGRLVGELVRLGDASAIPATYALLGGAALAGGATQTISAAVVLLEFTGSFVLSVPVLMTTIMACGVSYSFGFNIYDSIIRINGLDWLPGLVPQSDAETRVARDIMLGVAQLRFLVAEPTLGEITALLEDRVRRLESYPVVSSKEAMAFLGTIHRQDLARVLERMARREEFILDRLRERLPDDLGSGIAAHHSRSWFATISRLVHSTTRTIGKTWGAAHSNGNGGDGGDDGDHQRGGRHSLGGAALSGSPQGNGDGMGGTPPGGYGHSRRAQRLNLMILEQGGWDPSRIEEEAAGAFARQTVNLLALFADDEVAIDTSPWSVPATQGLSHLHVLFELLRIPRLFVVSGGQLLGVITRQALVDAVAGQRPAMGGMAAAARLSRRLMSQASARTRAFSRDGDMEARTRARSRDADAEARTRALSRDGDVGPAAAGADNEVPSGVPKVQ